MGALLIGYTMAIKRETDWFLAVIYVLLMGLGLHVILSLEYPNLLMPYGEFNRDMLLLKSSLS
jgi:cell division protein FtsW (lipid II flippase)